MKYKITIDLDNVGDLKQKLAELKSKINGIEGVHKTSFVADGGGKTLDTLSKLSMSVFGITSALSVLKSVAITLPGIMISSAASFESLRVRLVNLYQSQDKANEVFEKFKVIAATTPYELQNVVEAGSTLKAFGLNAEDTLKSVTDLAAFMGVDVVEAAQAVGRAFAGGAGAADILRERGVLNLIKSFKGIDDLTKLTLPEFRQAMLDTFQNPAAGIAGATDLLSQTYTGAISNMKDSLTNFSAAIGQKFTPTISVFARAIQNAAEAMTPVETEVEKATKAGIEQQATFTSLISTYEVLRFKTGATVETNSALKSVVDQLNKNFGSYLGNIDLATVKYDDFQKAVSKANDELIREAQIKLVNATKQDMINEVMQKEEERRKKVLALQKQIRDDQIALKNAQDSFVNEANARAKAQGAETAKMTSVDAAFLEASIKRNENTIEQLNNSIEIQKNKLKKDLSDYSNMYSDILNQVTSPAKPGKTEGGTPGLSDDLKKDLEALRKNIADKEALLKKEYETNRAFILKNVTDKQKQSKDLHDLDMKYAEDYQALKSGEAKEFKDTLDDKIKYQQDYAKESLEIENEIIKEIYEKEAYKKEIYDEFLNMQYNLNTSYRDRQIQEIRAFYAQYHDVLIEMGVTEEEIAEQRRIRIWQSSEYYRALSDIIGDTFDTTFQSIFDTSLNVHERWASIRSSLVSSSISAIGSILRERFKAMMLSITYTNTEKAAHVGAEAVKTAVTTAGNATRLLSNSLSVGKSIALYLKESLVAVGSYLKIIAVKIYSSFASIPFGLGIPVAAGIIAGIVAAIGKIKGFSSGGDTGGNDPKKVAGFVHEGEVVLENPIVKGQKKEILALRALMQKGYRLKDIVSGGLLNMAQVVMPVNNQYSYATGGYVNAAMPVDNRKMESLLETMINKLDILNINLVKKDMEVHVINTSNVKSTIKSIDQERKNLNDRGYQS